ncbi:MAG: ABC-F family ATP-binding cassette domain-containing protein [Clostridia bacterium]|nr:ABC-F family ATP-binding cassette domain-containing protein [Clostridia bacterium]
MSKIILNLKDIRLAFADRDILNIPSLSVYENEKIALVGENGAGKTTLLNLISGELRPDSGSVSVNTPFAYVHQADAQASCLSGGEKTFDRINEALASVSGLLLCDEPSANLDLSHREMLLDKLLAYDGALILVSHDRELISSVVNKIWLLEDGRINEFPGNYDDFLRERQRQRDFAAFEYTQYKKEKARLLAAAQAYREKSSQVKKAPSRMGNSEARLHKREATDAQLRLSHKSSLMMSRAERLEEKSAPRSDPEIRMDAGKIPPLNSRFAVQARELALSVPGKMLISPSDFYVETGRINALLGDNASGKTTLVRAILGTLSKDVRMDGDLRVHSQARIGAFTQDWQEGLEPSLSAFDNVMRVSVQDRSVVRTALARLSIRGENVFKPLSVMSGGEKAKVAMCALLMGSYNLLILDEPTNYLDVFTLEALEELLRSFPGTVLLVSHDRRFVNSIASRLLLIQDRHVVSFDGDLDQFEQYSARKAQPDPTDMTLLELHLAQIASRLAAPRKGDRPDLLNEEYERLAQQLRALRGSR